MTNLAYFECLSGASGDMILAAFLDAGLPLDHLRKELSRLDLAGYELETSRVMKQSLSASRFVVKFPDHGHHHHRTWADIRELIAQSGLMPTVKDKALAVFERLAAVEARMHGVEPDRVHFHEVGAVDSIIDIVGAAIAWEYFHLSRVTVSPLPLGSGWVDTAHGRLPLPAPATLALLKGVPTYDAGVEGELVTPTGAAILTTLGRDFGPRPSMTITSLGLGAGTMTLSDRPNVLRLAIGRSDDQEAAEDLVEAVTNIDDMNPEIIPYLVENLMKQGALDAWLTPIQMKKGRPAIQLSFLCRPDKLDDLVDLVLRESTSLGMRTHRVQRQALHRDTVKLLTQWGEVPLKKVNRGHRAELVPEYEVCREIAESSGQPLREIYEELRELGRRVAGED